MIHPLVRKELREHLWVLIALWALCAIALAGLFEALRNAGSPLEAYRRLVLSFGILVSLALVNRMVVREYGGRTQLFLETLPVGRGAVVAVKWLTGAACLLLPMAIGFAVTLLVAADEVVLTPRFVLLLGLRSLTFLLFFYALAFGIGLTGRYRYVLWAGFLLLLVIADSFGQLPVERWAPLQLVSGAMPFQRDRIPASWFWITWAATAVCVGLTFLLALGSRGSWVVELSRRMSLREKAIVAGVFLSAMYVVAQLDERKPKPAFEVLDAVVSDDGLPQVSIARTQELSDDDAIMLARQVAADVQEAREYLGLRKLPAVAVLPDHSLDPDLYMVAELPASDGVVVRGAAGTDGFDALDFRAFTLSRVLDWYSHGRAMREQRRWLLEGFAQRQVARNVATRRELLGLRAALAAQLIESDGQSLDAALRRWFATREKLGDCLGDALAWRAAELLAKSAGEAGFRKLAQGLFGARMHPDVRAILAEESLDDLLRDARAPSMAELVAVLQPTLRAERAQLADKLAAMRLWHGSVAAVPMRGTTYEVHYQVAPIGADAPPPFVVRYARIGPWESEVPRSSLARVDAVSQSGVLPASFARGTRVLTVVEMPIPELACTVRLDARRWEVQ